MENARICAILLAAGSGTRFSSDKTKQQVKLNGETVLKRAVNAFELCADITDIILVIRNGEEQFVTDELKVGFTKVRKIVSGGKTRAESASCGFFAMDFRADFVAIHDVARCLITPESISKVVIDAKKYGAASASSSVVDTVKRVDSDGFILKTERRSELRFASTPQIFRTDLYASAISSVDLTDPDITDDNLLMEKIGVKVYMTDIGTKNIKITFDEDASYARFLLGEKYV